MATSQNGWPVLEAGSPLLHRWAIPAKSGESSLTLRSGSAGFLLSHFLSWWSDQIEPLAGRQLDDWGWAYRPIRGQSSGFSNHASGTAADANATEHPLGTHTLSPAEKDKIAARLHLYDGALRQGAFYAGRVDEMHVELDRDLPAAEKVARRLLTSKRGALILAANPGQKAVILS